MNASLLLETILKGLKNEKGFENLAKTEINGNFFSAADIAVPEENGIAVYRIAVIPYRREND